MKIAVIGNGPFGLELAIDFINEGADVRVIGDGLPSSKIKKLSEFLEWNPQNYLRGETLSLLNIKKEEIKTAKDLWNKYYLKIIEFLGQRNVFYNRKVLRVQKRFLDPNESIPNHSRLYDLFRVVYSLDPSGLVEGQIEENPDMKDKLPTDILASLKNSIESFQDFDLVFDTRGPFQKPHYMGASFLPALNELSFGEKEGLFYGGSALKNEMGEEKTITLVGSEESALLIVLKLKDWLKKEGTVLNIVTTENSAFKEVLNSPKVLDSHKELLKGTIKKYLNDWRSQCEEVEKAIKEWRELPDHEKVKISQPQFPEPKLRIYEGYSVTSIDKLLDREGLFLTLEIPEWRSSEKKEMLTLQQDKVYVCRGFETIAPEFESEPGYFSILSESTDLFDASGGLSQIPLIKSDVFKYFSRA